MKWSKVYDTDFGVFLIACMEHNVEKYGLVYHTISHIESMYDYLDETGEPYSEALDWAVLGHDVIHDTCPKKELRSAEFFRKHSKEYGIPSNIASNAVEMIRATVKYQSRNKKVSPMIRAALHQLADPAKAISNYNQVMQEIMHLRGIDRYTFAQGNKSFLAVMAKRIERNKLELDTDNFEFFDAVSRGIEVSNQLSDVILNNR